METLPPPNLDHLSNITPNSTETVSSEAKAQADSSTAAYADPSAVIVVSRVTFNYVVIAIAFFALGSILSGAAVSALFNANSVENQALITSAAKAVAESSSANGQEVAGLVQGNIYDVSMDNDPARGANDAPITIVEFSDFHCAFCGRFAAETLDPLLKNYDGKISLGLS